MVVVTGKPASNPMMLTNSIEQHHILCTKAKSAMGKNSKSDGHKKQKTQSVLV
jgi:hypothetical protein